MMAGGVELLVLLIWHCVFNIMYKTASFQKEAKGAVAG